MPCVCVCPLVDQAPLWLEFTNADPLGGRIKIIYKAGDDLRQDKMTLNMIHAVSEVRWVSPFMLRTGHPQARSEEALAFALVLLHRCALETSACVRSCAFVIARACACAFALVCVCISDDSCCWLLVWTCPPSATCVCAPGMRRA